MAARRILVALFVAIIAISSAPNASAGGFYNVIEKSVDDLQSAMSSGIVTAEQLVGHYIDRILTYNSVLKGVIEINPDAYTIAAALDAERSATGARGPLHGIPFIVKDNIYSDDKLNTTAGSYALLGSVYPRESPIVKHMKAAGAILLAKASLSQWANFRGNFSSGWSSRGGQGFNPYNINGARGVTGGSSSGSGISAGASFAPLTIGTETSGSILSPSTAQCLSALKPSYGLTSRDGCVPLAETQDTIGPMCRNIKDAAYMLTAIVKPDPFDPPTLAQNTLPAGTLPSDWSTLLSATGLQGVKLGIARSNLASFTGSATNIQRGQYWNDAIAALQAAGAIIYDNCNVTTTTPGVPPATAANMTLTVSNNDFKDDIATYFQTVKDKNGNPWPIQTLNDLIKFNLANRELEMVDQIDKSRTYFHQRWLDSNATQGKSDPIYPWFRWYNIFRNRAQIDLAMNTTCPNVDALISLVSLTGTSASAQYPTSTVALGLSDAVTPGYGTACINLSFHGRLFDDAKLIKYAYAFEQTYRAMFRPRPVPQLFKDPIIPLEITLNADCNTWTEASTNSFVTAFATAHNILKSRIYVKSVKCGSVVLTLQIAPPQTQPGYPAPGANETVVFSAANAQTLSVPGYTVLGSSAIPPVVGGPFGDPHIMTYDGLMITLFPDGEYVMSEVESTGFKLHARFCGQEGDQASFTCSVAMKCSHSADTFELRNDEAGMEEPEMLVGGGRVKGLLVGSSYTANGVRITRPSTKKYLLMCTDDSYILEVKPMWNEKMQRRWIDVHGHPSRDMKGKTRGLLGVYDDDTRNDLTLRDGSITGELTEAMLKGYIDVTHEATAKLEEAWHVAAHESIFRNSLKTTADTSLPVSEGEAQGQHVNKRRRLLSNPDFAWNNENRKADAMKMCKEAGASGNFVKTCAFDLLMTGSADVMDVHVEWSTRPIARRLHELKW